MSNDQQPSTPGSAKPKFNLLDTAFILLTSCTLILFLFFMMGRYGERGLVEDLPQFIKDASSAVWTFVTGGLLSTVIYVIRRQVKGADHPNYLLWILVTTVALSAVIIGGGLMNKREGFYSLDIIVRDKETNKAIATGSVKIQPLKDSEFPEQPIVRGKVTFDRLTTEDTGDSIVVSIEAEGYKSLVQTVAFSKSLQFGLEKRQKVITPPEEVPPYQVKISIDNIYLRGKLQERLPNARMVGSGGDRNIFIYYDTAPLEENAGGNAFRYNHGGRVMIKMDGVVIYRSEELIKPTSVAFDYQSRAKVDTYLNGEIDRIVALEGSEMVAQIMREIQ